MRKLPDFFKPLIALTIFFFLSQNVFSQTDTLVKRQYIDDVHKSTTVVVKKDAADDFTILNQQFDGIGLGEVIFIKTENLQPAKPKSERTSFEDVVKETSKPSPTKASPSKNKPVAETKTKPVFAKKSPKKVNKKKTPTTPILETKKPQKYFGVGGARKVKTKKKKLKKRKRRRKKSQVGCFKF